MSDPMPPCACGHAHDNHEGHPKAPRCSGRIEMLEHCPCEAYEEAQLVPIDLHQLLADAGKIQADECNCQSSRPDLISLHEDWCPARAKPGPVTLEVEIRVKRTDGCYVNATVAGVRTTQIRGGSWNAVPVEPPSKTVANGVGVTELGAVLGLLSDMADAEEIS